MSASRLRMMPPRIFLRRLPTRLPRVDHRPGPLTFLRLPIGGLVLRGSVVPEGISLATQVRLWRGNGGTGISTCCPSATSFDLVLGPD